MSNEGRMNNKKKIDKAKLTKIGLGLSVLLVFAIIVGITFKGSTSKADEEDYLVDNLKVTKVTSTSAMLSWDECKDCKEYGVYKKASDGTYNKVKKTTSISYTIESLEPGQFAGTYTVVKYMDKNSDADIISVANHRKVVNVLTRPEGVTGLVCINKDELDAMNENKYIELQWNSAKGADFYNIYIKKENEIKYNFVQQVSSNKSKVNIDKKYLDNDVKIWVETVASKNLEKMKNERIDSNNTISLRISKDSLQLCQKSPYSKNKIDISWKSNSKIKIESLDFYILGDSSWKFQGKAKITEEKYTISKLQPNRVYDIKVITDNGEEYGRYRFVTIPEKVERVEVRNITDDSATLVWNDIKTKQYGIFIYDEAKKGYIMRGKTTSGNIHKLSGLSSYTYYKIIVAPISSVTDKGDDYSIIDEPCASFQTKVGKVKNLKIEEMTSSSVKVEWDKMSYATGYNVYVYNKKSENIVKESTVDNNYIYKPNKGENIDVTIKVEAYVERTNGNKKEREVSYVMSEVSAFNMLNYPTNVHIEKKVKGYIKLEWAKVYGAEKYLVYTVDTNADGTKKYNYVGETFKQFYEFEIDSLKEKTVFAVKAICDYNGEKIESNYSKECEYVNN